MQETHRSGHLKQTNKPHKHGRHRSKGDINASCKGKVSAQVISHRMKGELSKRERMNRTIQIRNKKRHDMLMKKRMENGNIPSPSLIAIIPLNLDALSEKIIDLFRQADDDALVTYSQVNILHLSVPRLKHRFSFFVPDRTDLVSILDAAKVADYVIFLISAASTSEAIIDNASQKVLTCLLSQGLPTAFPVLIDLEVVSLKKRLSFKQSVQSNVSKWLPEEKLISLEKNGDMLNLLRKICNKKRRTILQRDCRPYLLAEEYRYICDENSLEGTLQISGYLRGKSLSVNNLIHIPGWGDFQMKQIDGIEDPHLSETGDVMKSTTVLQVADPTKQVTLFGENIPDPMDAEQTWPTKEELEQATKSKRLFKKVPKGTSDYQACWIPDEDSEVESDEEIADDLMGDVIPSDTDESEWEEKDEELVSETEGDMEKYDASMDVDEEGNALRKLKASREEADFPDEVDTPQDIPAKDRFSKYRGLASFRTSPWDTKENLPPEYARIFQFENFDRTRRRVKKELEDRFESVSVGMYICIHVTGVPHSRVQSLDAGLPFVVCGLLPYENKLSVMHFIVKRASQSSAADLAIKSKDSTVIHCGFRRYSGRPIYSQHTNGTKHKYERFLLPDATAVASLYAPITFPPAAVLMFTESGALLATGRVMSANPDRLIIKRSVLSGHPFRVLKRSAIIRFMFFNRQDIEWFKPVELRTKLGRRGHIKEALGTHGHMKAVFDDQLKSQDTVIMSLYKRVFPPWSYSPTTPPSPPLYKVLTTITEEEESENMSS